MPETELLRNLVAINSIFPNEQKIGEYLEQQLQARNFTTRRIPIAKNRFNVVGERGTHRRPIAFYGHMDTVPQYGQWQGDPFQLREENGRLYGLGVYDMKAGIAAILHACELETSRTIRVAFGVDEENNSEGAWTLVQDGFFQGVEGVLVPEINDGTSEKMAIMLGRRGRTVYRFHVPGRSSHGAHIEKGVNALSEAARLVQLLETQNASLPTHTGFSSASQFVRKISGESTSLSLPETAIVELDRHLVPPETPESVLQELQRLLTGLYQQDVFQEIDGKRIAVSIQPRKMPYLLPYVTSPDHPLVQKLAAVVRSHTEPIYTYGASVADENVFAMQGIPIIGLCPVGGGFHSANEWVSKNSYQQLIQMLQQFIKSL